MKKLSIFNFQLSTSKGFTLIELLIVIAIIGVLSGLIMANFVGVRQRSRDGQRKANLRQIQAALELYRADNGSYPSSIGASCGSGVSITSINGSVTYLKDVPCDPLSSAPPTSYKYASCGGTSTISYSLRACLENSNDQESDSITGRTATCTSTDCGSAGANFTLNNP